MPNTDKTNLKQDLGIIAAISIIIGNMIGSGIYGLPSGFAKVATPSITVLSWVTVAAGAIIIALSYGNLSRAIPKAGGPVVFAEAAMGNFCGYAVSLIWWVGAAIGNAAIVELFFTTCAELIPGIQAPIYRLIITMFTLWFFTYINIIGVRFAGWVSIVSNILKFIVFGLVIIVAIPYFDLDILSSNELPNTLVDKPDVSFFTMFSSAIAMLLGIYWIRKLYNGRWRYQEPRAKHTAKHYLGNFYCSYYLYTTQFGTNVFSSSVRINTF